MDQKAGNVEDGKNKYVLCIETSLGCKKSLDTGRIKCLDSDISRMNVEN